MTTRLTMRCDQVVLPEEISPGSLPFHFNSAPKAVFLTGATGFLGCFLLESLLTKHPTTTIYCLVRGKDDHDARDRLVANMAGYQLWKASFETRVVVIAGDLGKPKFGLSMDTWSTLATDCEQIIHNGALVHWVYPYSKLKPGNVDGTIEALRLSCTSTIKPFHFVSSTSVFDSDQYVMRMEPVPETDPLSDPSGLSSGYGQSKWVAEQLVMVAMKRGLPANIFRPGYIVGHSRSGLMNIDDFLVRLLKGVIELGTAPEIGNTINMCPVDYIADSIVNIATDEMAVQQCFHMVNPNPFTMNDYFQAAQSYGYMVQQKEYLTWREELMAYTMQANNSALYPLLHFVLDDLPTKSKGPTLDYSNFTSYLSKHPTVRCPTITSLMGIYIAYLVQCGYLEPPNGPTEDSLKLPQLSLTNVSQLKRTSSAM